MVLFSWNRGIRAQLLKMSAVPFVVVAVLGIASFVGLQKLKQSIDYANDQQLPSSLALGAMDSSLSRIQLRLYETYTTPVIDKAGRNKSLAEVKNEIQKFDHAHEDFKQIGMSDQEKLIYQKFVAHLENERKFFSQAVQGLEKHTKEENDQVEALIQGPLADGLSPLMDAMSAFHQLEREAMLAAKTDTDKAFLTVSRSIGAVSVIGMVLLFLVVFRIARKIANDLIHLSIGLGETQESVVNSSVKLSEASSQISDSSNRTASAVQETLAALTEVSTTVSQNSADAGQARDMAESNLETTAEGRASVQKMIDAIDEIKTSNQAIASSIAANNAGFANILSSISNIQQKTRVINEIVFQTKLLSFNASVEAARAGEHGRGFSVVAEEIGNLAQMSGLAATEISTVLDMSVQQVQQVINSSKATINEMLAEGERKVLIGSEVAQLCGKVFEKILDNASVGVKANAQIARASNEQATAIDSVDKALHDISHSTDSNRDMSNQASTISSDLSNESKNLRLMVERLKFIVHGELLEEVSVLPGANGGGATLPHPERHRDVA